MQSHALKTAEEDGDALEVLDMMTWVSVSR